jgi:acetyl-CoA C-acetyltransferase
VVGAGRTDGGAGVRAATRSTAPVFVLGGAQTDFARHWTREGLTLTDLMRDTAQGALRGARVDASAIEVGHVANFVAELFCGQGHLGGLLVEADRAFEGMPTSTHEAACAAGGAALMAAMADIESGRYDCALVIGVELMRNVKGDAAAQHLGAAAYVPRETEGVPYPWPQLFSDLGDEYDRRYGIRHHHLAALAQSNFANARRNPRAQTRAWVLAPENFTEDQVANPVVAGRIRKQDCSQITDGGAAVVLASARFAAQWARREGESLEAIPVIQGWGHRTGRMSFADKIAASRDEAYVLPHVRGAITDAYARAGVAGPAALDAIETHDCFTTTHYMAIDHFGLTAPGESWKSIEDGVIQRGGRCPMNTGGGLTGGGHPIGATGVRMVLDAATQVRGAAGDCQVEGARTVATLNLGGSGTTAVCTIVGRAG